MSDDLQEPTTNEILTGILYRLRAIHMALIDPAEARRQFDMEMAAAERRQREANGEATGPQTVN